MENKRSLSDWQIRKRLVELLGIDQSVLRLWIEKLMEDKDGNKYYDPVGYPGKRFYAKWDSDYENWLVRMDDYFEDGEVYYNFTQAARELGENNNTLIRLRDKGELNYKVQGEGSNARIVLTGSEVERIRTYLAEKRKGKAEKRKKSG